MKGRALRSGNEARVGLNSATPKKRHRRLLRAGRKSQEKEATLKLRLRSEKREPENHALKAHAEQG